MQEGYKPHAVQVELSERDTADWVTALSMLSDVQRADILLRLLKETGDGWLQMALAPEL